MECIARPNKQKKKRKKNRAIIEYIQKKKFLQFHQLFNNISRYEKNVNK